MLNAITQYMYASLNGLTSPFYDVAEAELQTPLPDDVFSNPKIYIWCTYGNVDRQSGPRNAGGFKNFNYSAELYLLMNQASDDPNQDQAFPCFIDALMITLSTLVIPQKIVDPTTSVESYITSVGEKMKWNYAIPMQIGNQGLMRYSALVTATIEEKVQL